MRYYAKAEPLEPGIRLPATLQYDEAGGMDCLTPAWLVLDATGCAILRVDTRDLHYNETCPGNPDNKKVLKAAEKLAEAIVNLINNQGTLDQIRAKLPIIQPQETQNETLQP